jgi:uncharacterized membrane protein
MRPKVKKLILMAPFAIAGIVVFTAIGGGIVQFLWNWLVPAVFGLPVLTFWQALALLALCRILFGGHGWSRSGRRHMSDEERERFRQRMRERWGWDGANPTL